MAGSYRIEHVAKVPRGWKVRTVSQGDHEVRIAFPSGARQQGSGHVVEILHPRHENASYCPARARMTNPAELVLMGMAGNPMRKVIGQTKPRKGETVAQQKFREYKERVERMPKPIRDVFENKTRHHHHNPSRQHYGIRWDAGNVTGSYNSRAIAERVLRSFHGKGKVIALNPSPLRRRNPVDAETAREIRTGFVDRESRRYIVMDEPHIPPGDYAELGILFSLAVKPANGGEVRDLEFNSGIHVISDTTRRQIYFAGGNQRLTERELQIFTGEAANNVELGGCREIIYVAKKYHPEVGNAAAGRAVEWRHKFGEESGAIPQLWYDTKNDRLLLRGGEYRVEDAGIVN